MKKTMMKRLLSIVISICVISGSFLSASSEVSAAPVTSIKTKGNVANVVVFVDFKDTTHEGHSAPQGEYAPQGYYGACYHGDAEPIFRLYNGSEECPKGMRQYLYNISYGQMEVANIFPQFDPGSNKMIPYRLANDTDYYTAKGAESEIVREVLERLEKNGDLTENADRNNDGIMDNLTIVIPCDTGSTNYKYEAHMATYGGREHKVNNLFVSSYNLIPEGAAFVGNNNPGVITHEFLHSMGYPDLYIKNSDGSPIGLWDIMASANKYMPYPCAWLRSNVTKWFSIPTVTQSQKGYSLYAAAATTSVNKDQQAVILKTGYSNTEFFVVEYRKSGTSRDKDYEYLLPGSGLIIYRVDTKRATNIEGAPYYIYVFRPGDSYDSNGHEKAEGDINKAHLSADTRSSYGSGDPAKSLADGAITYSDGTNSGIIISNVGSADKDQITFDITFADVSSGNYWKTVSEQPEESTQIASYMDTDGKMYYLQKKSAYGPAYLYQYDGVNWTQRGNALNGVSYGAQLCKYNGNFYAAYLDSSTYCLKLAKFNGTSWSIVYTATMAANEMSVCAGTDGIYMTYPDSDRTKMYAFRYTSSGSTQLGSQVCSGNEASNPSITTENGKVAVMYRESHDGNRIRVKFYDSASKSWKDAGNSSLYANSGMIKLHKNVIYMMKNGTGQIGGNASDMYRYDLSANSGTWERVGTNSYANESIVEMDICFHGDAPYVIYQGASQRGTIIKTQVMNLVNGQWVALGNKIASETITSLKAYSDGNNIYVTYLSDLTRRVNIKSHQSSNKSPVTGGGSSSGNTGSNIGGSTGTSTGAGTTTTKPADKPTVPVNTSGIKTLSVTQTKYNTLQLNWSKVENAKTYEIYYSTSATSGFRKLASTNKNVYKFSKAKCGQTYYFMVRVGKKSGKNTVYGNFCPAVSGRTVISGTLSVSVSKTTYNSVTIKWNKIKDAAKYEIYYSTSPNGGYSLLKLQGGTSFTHKQVQTGVTYYYKVRPVRDSFKGNFSNEVSAKTVLAPVTNLKVAASGSDRLTISWKKVPGAQYYVVLRSDSKQGPYYPIANTGTAKYVNTGLPASTCYYYKVYAVSGSFRTAEAGPVMQITKAAKKK